MFLFSFITKLALLLAIIIEDTNRTGTSMRLGSNYNIILCTIYIIYYK